MSNFPSQLKVVKTDGPVYMEVISKYHVTREQQQEELKEVQEAKKTPAKFEVLYNRYHEQIFRYVYQRVEDKDSAFDITQQVFLKAMTNLHKYEYRGLPFSSWLYRIAKSETYEALRQNQKLRAVNMDEHDLHEVIGEMGEKKKAWKINMKPDWQM